MNNSKQIPWFWVIAFLLAIGAGILLLQFVVRKGTVSPVTYKGKPLSVVFYGGRTNFYYETRQRAAQEAINALGTNAFPFLISNLKAKNGNGAVYFKFYYAMPRWFQNRLSYPVSGDDLKFVTFGHIMKMPRLPADYVQALADCVPKFNNPRVRMGSFNSLVMKYGEEPACLDLTRKLLDDPVPAIQLEAAVELAKTGLRSDPREPRLFPILLLAIVSKQSRSATTELWTYYFQQQPPGAPGRLTPKPSDPFAVPPDQALQVRIRHALGNLKPYLTEQQKIRLKETEETLRKKGELKEF